MEPQNLDNPTPPPLPLTKRLSPFFGYRALVVCVLIFFGAVTLFFWTLPDVKEMKGCLVTSLFNVKLCPGSKDYVRLGDISNVFRQTVLIAEDYSFFSHDGFDFDAMKDSFKANLKSGRVMRGGSTITQQLVKNVFLSSDKTIIRKLREAVLTYWTEKEFTKNEIYERYLNVVQFGKNIYGVRAAARHYFLKAPSQLNALESAFLAMLLPSPEKYSVSFGKGKLTPFAKSRVLVLLTKTARKGSLTTWQYIRAKSVIDDFPWYGVDLNAFMSQDVATPDELKTGAEETSSDDSEEKLLPEEQSED